MQHLYVNVYISCTETVNKFKSRSYNLEDMKLDKKIYSNLKKKHHQPLKNPLLAKMLALEKKFSVIIPPWSDPLVEGLCQLFLLFVTSTAKYSIVSGSLLSSQLLRTHKLNRGFD